MFRHLFLLIWNKKRTHTLLLIEITASFLVLFGLGSLLTYNVRNYREPLGFSYENVWAIDLNNNQDSTAVGQKVQAVVQRLKSYPEIESVSRMSTNFPFSANTSSNMISHGDAKVHAQFFTTDESFAQTLTIPLVAGRWYRNADSVGKFEPIVLNRKAQVALFADKNPLGQLVSDRYKVVGVVGNFKSKGEYGTDSPALFELVDATSYWQKTMLIRVRPGTDAVFEAKLVRDLTALLPGWSSEVTYLTDSRQNQHNLTQVPVIIAVIVSGFLLINVALGLFGVLNVSITRRRGEIGLRRALGATGSAVSWQFVGEMWVLATFALALGLLLAGQFPLLHVFDLDTGVYLIAMLLATLIIYLLVTICALYPSRQAATIQPAVALHEE